MTLVVLAVALTGIGVGAALANRNDTPATTADAQLADITQACSAWMNESGTGSTAWCQDMTGWMSQHMADVATMGQMMWNDSDRMVPTCRAWMTANPSTERPVDWCDEMMRSTWPHMNGDGDHRDGGDGMHRHMTRG